MTLLSSMLSCLETLINTGFSYIIIFQQAQSTCFFIDQKFSYFFLIFCSFFCILQNHDLIFHMLLNCIFVPMHEVVSTKKKCQRHFYMPLPGGPHDALHRGIYKKDQFVMNWSLKVSTIYKLDVEASCDISVEYIVNL